MRVRQLPTEPGGRIHPSLAHVIRARLPTEQPESPIVLYTVRRSDTLSVIAKRKLHDAGRWREIFELNPT